MGIICSFNWSHTLILSSAAEFWHQLLSSTACIQMSKRMLSVQKERLGLFHTLLRSLVTLLTEPASKWNCCLASCFFSW